MSRPETKMEFRKAAIGDVKAIQRVINDAAARGEMLPRPLGDIYEKLRDFHVCCTEGRLAGCCALHVVWEGTAEIRSLAVDTSSRQAGIGTTLVKLCVEESRRLGVGKIFLLTYIPAYFAKHGFREVNKDSLPHKIWSDCVKCPKFPDCGEVAMEYVLDGMADGAEEG